MILTVDVGNTNIVLGAFEGEHLLFSSRIQTEADKTSDQYAIAFNSILRLHGAEPGFCTGAVLSCVVPPLQTTLKNAIRTLTGCTAMTVGPGLKTGLKICIDNPAILGSDLVCGAVAALERYGGPCIVMDLGTATKISAIDANGAFIGCSIMPGIGISLRALSTNTAQLPHIDFETAQHVIGTNTVDSMKSGVVYGTASMMDGMIRKFRRVIGENAPVVATGGFAGLIAPFCEVPVDYDEQLVMEGMRLIYLRNAKK